MVGPHVRGAGGLRVAATKHVPREPRLGHSQSYRTPRQPTITIRAYDLEAARPYICDFRGYIIEKAILLRYTEDHITPARRESAKMVVRSMPRPLLAMHHRV